MKLNIFTVLISIFFYVNQSFAYEVGQNKNFELRAAYQVSIENYELAGQSGFTTKTGFISGSGLSAAVKWNRSEARYFFEYLSLLHETSSPTGIAPTSIESKFTRYLFSVQPKSRGSYGEGYGRDGLKYDIGLDIRQRSSDVTTPNQYLPSQNSGGVHIAGSYIREYNQETYFEMSAGLYLPLYRDEITAKTGYYRFSFNPDAKINVVHKIGKSIDVSAGAAVIYENIYYSATGERGTTKANETYMNIQVPVELRFQF